MKLLRNLYTITSLLLFSGLMVCSSSGAADKPDSKTISQIKKALQQCTNNLGSAEAGKLSAENVHKYAEKYFVARDALEVSGEQLAYVPKKNEAPYFTKNIRDRFAGTSYEEMFTLCNEGMKAAQQAAGPLQAGSQRKSPKVSESAQITGKRKLVAADPNNANLHYNLALAIHTSIASQLDARLIGSRSLNVQEKTKAADAEKEYRQAITLADNHGRAHIMLGYLLRQLGRYDEAIPELEIGLQLPAGSDDWYVAADGVARCYIHKKQFAQAIPYLEEIIGFRPNDVQSLIMLAGCYFDVGRIEESRALYSRVLELDPANRDAQRALNNMNK